MELSLSNSSYVILKVGYAIFIICIGFLIFKNIRKNEHFSFIDFFNFYYMIAYGISPFFCLDNPSYRTFLADLKASDERYLFIVFWLSVVVFLLINLTYLIAVKFLKDRQHKTKKEDTIEKTHFVDVDSKKFLILNIALVIFAWVCLILWTRAFGSIFGAFKYASAMRDGDMYISNPFSFLFKFCGLFVMTTYGLFFFLKRNIRKRNSSIAIAIVFFILSAFGLFIHFINNDSRSLIMYFCLALFLLVFGDRLAKLKIKNLFIGGLALICGLLLIMNLDHFTKFIQDGDVAHLDTSSRSDNNFFVKEFSFVYINNINTLYMMDNQHIFDVELRIFENLKEIPFAWFPITLKPESIENLNSYNSSFYPSANGGEIPADLITGSILTLGYPGILFVPIFYALIIVALDWYFGLRNNFKLSPFMYMVKCYLLWCLPLNFVTYIDIAPILSSHFSILIYICVMKIGFEIKNITLPEKRAT